MKWQEWLENWGMSPLKIKAPFSEAEWQPKGEDKDAAWELYIELLTRITTQPLSGYYGDEATALESVHNIFSITRDAIKRHGRLCIEFTKIAIIVLNQEIRPFTTKWHKLMLVNAFKNNEYRIQFRTELEELQRILRIYTKMLSDMAGVEDLTELEA